MYNKLIKAAPVLSCGRGEWDRVSPVLRDGPCHIMHGPQRSTAQMAPIDEVVCCRDAVDGETASRHTHQHVPIVELS